MTDENPLKPYAVEVSVANGRDVTWEAVTQPPVLRQWFGWDYDGLDAEIQQIFVDEATFLAPERMGWADGSFLEVTGDDERSTVRAVRGNPPARDPERYDAIEEGWKTFLIQLRHLLEQSPQGRRRTLYLTGTATGRQALGLLDADWTTVGSRVAWALDADVLVVASGRQPLEHPEAGRLEIIVSTFGVDDAAFATYHKDWSERWAPLARGATVTVSES